MQISDWTIWVLAAVLLLNTGFIAGLTFALVAAHRKMDDALRKADPVLERTVEALTRLEETTLQLQQRVDQILDRTSRIVERVGERVDTTTAVAEETVTRPLIGAASLMAGIRRGLQAYAERTRQKGDGRNGGQA